MINLGKNAQCHCGSGKKYKKCCINSDASTPKLSERYHIPFRTRFQFSLLPTGNQDYGSPKRNSKVSRQKTELFNTLFVWDVP